MWSRFDDYSTGFDHTSAIYNPQRKAFQSDLYLELLKKWNDSISVNTYDRLTWDELDVTTFVVSEAKTDRSLTLLLLSDPRWMLYVSWWSSRDSDELEFQTLRTPEVVHNREEWHPHLVVEYDLDKATTSAPAIKARTQPVVKKKTSESPSAPTVKTEAQSTGKKGTLVIFSTPSGADVLVNGTMVGTTSKSIDLRLPMEAGQIKVRIEKEGYIPWEREISVGEGLTVPVEAELKKIGD